MEKKNKKTNNKFKILITMSIIVVIIWALSGFLTYYFVPEWSDRGTFGDMFGAVNGLFSGLAFAALIYTIILQREEMKMNRDEIIMNRKELKKSAAAQESSQLAQKEQVLQTHLTTKINAMSTIINYYNTQINNPVSSPELVERSRLKRRALIKQMDDLIDGMQDSEVE